MSNKEIMAVLIKNSTRMRELTIEYEALDAEFAAMYSKLSETLSQSEILALQTDHFVKE